jgi:hypothetical protein
MDAQEYLEFVSILEDTRTRVETVLGDPSFSAERRHASSEWRLTLRGRSKSTGTNPKAGSNVGPLFPRCRLAMGASSMRLILKGERHIWLEPRVLDRLKAMRGPGESYSDVILSVRGGDSNDAGSSEALVKPDEGGPLPSAHRHNGEPR